MARVPLSTVSTVDTAVEHDGGRNRDHSFLFLPWILAVINLGLALYGHIRLNGSSVLTATLACYLLLSMPYLNVHTALAGYADIWLAAAFSLAIFALGEWHLNRSWSYGMLVLLMAFFCSQIKAPGLVLDDHNCFREIDHKRQSKNGDADRIQPQVLIALIFWYGVDLEIPHSGTPYTQHPHNRYTCDWKLTRIPCRLGKIPKVDVCDDQLEHHLVSGGSFGLVAMLRENLMKQLGSRHSRHRSSHGFHIFSLFIREDYHDVNIVTTLNRACCSRCLP